jgi:carbon-monoxide dehydrogenase medium subunit
VKAAQFSYTNSTDVDDALQMLAKAQGAAKAMSGSQSLGPMLNLRLARPAQVVDIAQIPDLRAVRSDTGWITIGAAVTHAELEDGIHAELAGHPVRGVAGGIAYRAIRTRGTIGGSLAHADPAADWVVALTALGARVRLKSSRGERTVPADALMVGAYTTVLEPDELIISVAVPGTTPATRWGYHKLCRKPGEFAEASAAVYLDPSRNSSRIALGAVDGPPVLLTGLAAQLASKGANAPNHEQLLVAVRTALPGRDGIDLKFFAACLQRALQQAGIVPLAEASGGNH